MAYNWGFAKWQECYKAGIKKNYLELKKSLTQSKKSDSHLLMKLVNIPRNGHF
ncbi:hypothetical protein DSN88_09130 [Campylobacter jejuni]|nr:hypothetical protein [Campylobacter jejuni]